MPMFNPEIFEHLKNPKNVVSFKNCSLDYVINFEKFLYENKIIDKGTPADYAFQKYRGEVCLRVADKTLFYGSLNFYKEYHRKHIIYAEDFIDNESINKSKEIMSFLFERE